MQSAPPSVTPGTKGVKIVMAPGYRITGRLPVGDDAYPYYDVVAWSKAGGPGIVAHSLDDGFFEISGLRPGNHVLMVHRHGTLWPGDFNGTARVESVAAGTRGLKIELKQAGTTQLGLLDRQGNRLHAAVVYLRGKNLDTRVYDCEEDQPFRVEGVPPGNYHFDVTLADGTTRSVGVRAGQTAKMVLGD